MTTIGPTWDNSSVYSSLSAPEVSEDLKAIESFLLRLDHLTEELDKSASSQSFGGTLPFFLESLETLDSSLILLRTLMTYCNCRLSVDAKDSEAQSFLSSLDPQWIRWSTHHSSVMTFLVQVPESEWKEWQKDDGIISREFLLKEKRSWSAYQLFASQEEVLASTKVNGLDAWGNLYTDLSSELKIKYQGQEYNMAQASKFLTGPNSDERREVLNLMNQEWARHQVTFAHIINALNGQRWVEFDLRSKSAQKKDKSTPPLGPLKMATRQSRISEETLEALMGETYERRSVGQRACFLMAKKMGKKAFEPSDILAPYPDQSKESEAIPFEEAIHTISEAFRVHSHEMADFVHLMNDKKWIEASDSPRRRPGAYCTKFPKDRTPRVYMTYTGTMKNLITLAHELGHAYHNWVMRDLPFHQCSYPMTLAETASVMAETMLKDFLLQKTDDSEKKAKILWQEAQSAQAFLLNIPTRYEFELNMVNERRKSSLSPERMKELMSEAFVKWYGEALSEPDPYFWASKLHFSISRIGFYNYPYLFGQLFGLTLYAQKKKLGEAFFPRYRELLLDTGRMSAEDLVKKHLGQNLYDPSFWRGAFEEFSGLLDQLEELL